MFSANGKYEGDPSGLLHRSDQRLLPNVPATCSVPVALLLKVPASRPGPDTGRVPLPRFCCHDLTRSSPPSLLVGRLCRCRGAAQILLSGKSFLTGLIFTELVSGVELGAVRPAGLGEGCKELGTTWDGEL